MFGRLLGKSAAPQPKPASHSTAGHTTSFARNPNSRGQTYSKVFRWKLPKEQVDQPKSVHVVGSFTHWKPVPLKLDPMHGTWQATIDGIPSGKTHHYMLLLDGHPTYDPHCDGLAVAHGHDEHQYQLSTEKGHRVLVLFGQAK